MKKQLSTIGRYVGSDGRVYLRNGQPEFSYTPEEANRNLEGLKHLDARRRDSDLKVTWLDAIITLSVGVALMAGMAALLFFLTLIIS